jgi:hypothetical protein
MLNMGGGVAMVCAVKYIQLEFLGGVIVNFFAVGGIICV